LLHYQLLCDIKGKLEKAKKLKEKGNKYFQGKNYEKAIELYSEALELAGESPEAAVFYSNRAACYSNLVLSSFQKKKLEKRNKKNHIITEISMISPSIFYNYLLPLFLFPLLPFFFFLNLLPYQNLDDLVIEDCTSGTLLELDLDQPDLEQLNHHLLISLKN